MLTSCSYQRTRQGSKWVLTQAQRDSVEFSVYHHYNVGYNFICTADSMMLHPNPEGIEQNIDYPHDDTYLYDDEDFVITEVFHNNNIHENTLDSIWLCIGSDGIPLGWISEQDLIHNTTPVDPISRFMAFCTRHHKLIGWIFLGLIVIVIAFQYFHNGKKSILSKQSTGSVYIPLFIIAATSAAAVLALMKCRAPEMWAEFYYYPSLNPLGQPPMLTLFLSLMWLSCILFLAIYFEIKDKASIGRALQTMSFAAILTGWLFSILPVLRQEWAIIFLYVFVVSLIVWDYSKPKKKAPKEEPGD